MNRVGHQVERQSRIESLREQLDRDRAAFESLKMVQFLARLEV